MKKKLLGLLLLAGTSVFAAPRFSVGIGIGGPAPVAARFVRPPCPGPGYVWVDPYYDSYGSWVGGYWSAPVVRYGGYDRGYARGYERRDFDRDRFHGNEHGNEFRGRR